MYKWRINKCLHYIIWLSLENQFRPKLSFYAIMHSHFWDCWDYVSCEPPKTKFLDWVSWFTKKDVHVSLVAFNSFKKCSRQGPPGQRTYLLDTHNTFRKHLGRLYARGKEGGGGAQRCQLRTKSAKRVKCKICLKLTLKILQQGQLGRSGLFIVNVKQFSHLFVVFLLLTLWTLAFLNFFWL